MVAAWISEKQFEDLRIKPFQVLEEKKIQVPTDDGKTEERTIYRVCFGKEDNYGR